MTDKTPSPCMLDISRHLLPIKEVEIFGDSYPLMLEIGFGEGEFICHMAKKNSKWNFVGIEIKYFRFKKALNLLQKHRISNVKLIHIEASIAVQQVFDKKIFHGVYINFPDPWPKEKHTKHRLINERFLNSIYSVMKPKAILEFVTDSLSYTEHTKFLFENYPGFRNVYSGPLLDKTRPVTRFQTELASKGNIYMLIYEKV